MLGEIYRFYHFQKVHLDIISACFGAGLVYNVSPYMEYHPGGEDELMRAAGADGTDLFNEVSFYRQSEPCMLAVAYLQEENACIDFRWVGLNFEMTADIHRQKLLM